jgi:hypothetical protein
MTIIMLGRLYFMLSCWLAPTDAAPMQHGRYEASEATCDLTRSHLHLDWPWKPIEPGSLVGFRCEDTCHMVDPDPRSD